MSFTAAAAELNVTPTAVSQKIKLLEQRLGVVLFQRTTRRVALTEPGAALHAKLGPALSDVQSALAALGDYRGRPTGTLRLTAPRMSADSLIAPLASRLRAAYPELSLEISLDDAFVDIVAGGFDAGIRLGNSVEKDMIRVPLTPRSCWSIVGSPGYFAEHGRPRTPEDLLGHHTIRQRMLATGVVYRWELEQRGKPIVVDVPGGVIVDDVGLLVSLAREGAGLAYVPDEAAAADLASGQLERVLQSHLSDGPGLCLYFPTRMQEQPKVRALIEIAKSFRLSKTKRTPKRERTLV